VECSERKELQQKCISASDEYDAAVSRKWENFFPEFWAYSQPRSELLRLYSDRLKASGELSKHLSQHRC